VSEEVLQALCCVLSARRLLTKHISV